MAQLPHIIETCSICLKPNILATYASELVDLFNQFYKFVPVLSCPYENIKLARLRLVYAFKIVLSVILDTLGIDKLEQM